MENCMLELNDEGDKVKRENAMYTFVDEKLEGIRYLLGDMWRCNLPESLFYNVFLREYQHNGFFEEYLNDILNLSIFQRVCMMQDYKKIDQMIDEEIRNVDD